MSQSKQVFRFSWMAVSITSCFLQLCSAPMPSGDSHPRCCGCRAPSGCHTTTGGGGGHHLHLLLQLPQKTPTHQPVLRGHVPDTLPGPRGCNPPPTHFPPHPPPQVGRLSLPGTQSTNRTTPRCRAVEPGEGQRTLVFSSGPEVLGDEDPGPHPCGPHTSDTSHGTSTCTGPPGPSTRPAWPQDRGVPRTFHTAHVWPDPLFWLLGE